MCDPWSVVFSGVPLTVLFVSFGPMLALTGYDLQTYRRGGRLAPVKFGGRYAASLALTGLGSGRAFLFACCLEPLSLLPQYIGTWCGFFDYWRWFWVFIVGAWAWRLWRDVLLAQRGQNSLRTANHKFFLATVSSIYWAAFHAVFIGAALIVIVAIGCFATGSSSRRRRF